MTEEGSAPDYVDTKFRVDALEEGKPLRESERARVTIEGQTEVILVIAEIALAAMKTLFGAEIGQPMNDKGEPILPPQIDILDTGDEPVAA